MKKTTKNKLVKSAPVPKKIKTGNKNIDRLYEAVVSYVNSGDGTVTVIGGIAIVQESPLKYNYGVMIRVTGKKPKFK